MKFPNYKNNFSFLPKNALYRADNITANHFFTTRNSDTDILPFEIIQAEKQIHSADIIYINDDNINIASFCTACDTNNFYSFRKEKKLNGTMISAIQI